MPYQPHAFPEPPTLHGQRQNKRLAKPRNPRDTQPVSRPQGPTSHPRSWKSTIKRGLCCIEPPSQDAAPNSPASSTLIAPSLEPQDPKQQNNHVLPCWTSSLDACIQRSDGAHRDVFNQLRAMMAAVNTTSAQPPPPPTASLARPPSEAVSQLDPRASLHSLLSVSELGAEAEPAWLAAAAPRVDAQARHDPLLGFRPARPSPESRNSHGRDRDELPSVARSAAGGRNGRKPAVESPSAPRARAQKKPRAGYERSYPVGEAAGAPVSDTDPYGTNHAPVRSKLPVPSRSYSKRTQPHPRLRQRQRRPSGEAAFSTPLIPPKSTLRAIYNSTENQPATKQLVYIPTGSLPPQQETISHHPAPTAQPTPPCPPPLTALLYFTLELPRGSSTHSTGTYLRHFAHPMRLPLSSAAQLRSSIAHLRGYLTDEPERFLSHFSTPTNTTPTKQLVVNFPALFAAPDPAVEKIWGRELRWAWADASEERFAEAVVGVLREVAEGRVAKGMGGVVDVICVVREVVDGRKGYGLLMDVRRTVGLESQRKRGKMITRAPAGHRMSIH